MLKETKVNKGNRFSKVVEYVEPTRVGKTALKKQEIVDKYPESLQLNLLRKAILGDAEAIKALQDMEDDVNKVI